MEEGDALTTTTKGGPDDNEQVLDIDVVQLDDENKKESYRPHDDPNEMGQAIPETELLEVDSSRLDIDEIAESYFGNDEDKKNEEDTIAELKPLAQADDIKQQTSATIQTATFDIDIDEMMVGYFDEDDEEDDGNESAP